MLYSEDIQREAEAHARSVFPNESVGFVVDGTYVPQKNVATDSENNFTVPAQALLEQSGPVQGIIHSHPNGPNYPNKIDMQGQIDTDVPWGILPINKYESSGEYVAQPILWWGDSLPIRPLIGRGFIHGVSDCYALIRDYYRTELGITIPDFPRDWGWWTKGEKLYDMGFGQAGFVQVSMSDPKPGDVFLAAIRCKTPNHGGIWLGGPTSEILHHLTSRNAVDITWLSRREPGVRYLNFVQNGGKWLRHKEML